MNKEFGSLLSQIEHQLDFTKKYNKLTVPMVLFLLPIFFLIPGLADWILGTLDFYELTGATDEIPAIVLWGFLGAATFYLAFCIIRINKSKGYLLSLYQKGAVLELIKKTVKFHFDDFKWAEYGHIMKYTKYREAMASICINGKTIDIFEVDIPDVGIFVEEISIAYVDYAIDKIKSHGINRMTIHFGTGTKLESSDLVDTIFGSKRMPLRNVKSVEMEPKGYKINGTLDTGKEEEFFWGFKHFYNDELFNHIINEFTSVEEITIPQVRNMFTSTEETTSSPTASPADAMVSEKMQAFEQKHRLPQEKEDWLAFSSILALSNYDSPKVFAMQWAPKFLIKRGLKSMWAVTNRQSTLDTLAELAAAKCSAPRANSFYAEIKETGIVSQIYKQARENLLKLGFDESVLDNITTLNAWDYGRAGFIARNAVFCGFLKEEETWKYLQQAAVNASKEYSSWREYLAAYILGRDIAYGNSSEDILQILEYLLRDKEKDRLFLN